jgi:hypothetical protein
VSCTLVKLVAVELDELDVRELLVEVATILDELLVLVLLEVLVLVLVLLELLTEQLPPTKP